MNIGELLQRDLSKPIEEIVKVSQQDEKVVLEEIQEYVATRRIREQYLQVLGPIADFHTPTERVGVWVSGFFGSGKSSFLKNLGYILSNRSVMGEPAGSLFIKELEKQAPYDAQVGKVADTLNFINQGLRIQVLMFDVQVDLPAGGPADSLTRVMYDNLLRALDYPANDHNLAELEIELEHEGRLAAFVRRCAAVYGGEVRAAALERAAPPDRAFPLPPTLAGSGVSADEYRVWRVVRGGASRLGRASRLLHELDGATYPTADSWAQHQQREPDVTVGLLVRRTFELADRRRNKYGVVYVMDEVGRYVAESTARLENLRAIVEQFGKESQNRVGRLVGQAPAPVWLIVSSQEKLDEVVHALGGERRVDLAKVQDRFQTRVDMVPADIREVATRRVLAKKPAGEQRLGQLFDQHGARLKTHTRLERTARKQEMRRDEFILFYPYLPHFIDLSIEIVSGLRGLGGAPRHIGGSNRTLIKQAYEMLVHPRIRLKDRPVGALVTLEPIYDLLEGSLPSETRHEIEAIAGRAGADDPWPARVAKALALLQPIRDLPRTEENVAALLYGRLGDDSPLPDVRRAIAWLAEHQYVGQEQGAGWKLLSTEEIRWQRERDAHQPYARDKDEILAAQLKALFDAPALSAALHGGRTFRTRVEWRGRVIQDGAHLPVQLRLADGPEAFAAEVEMAAADSHTQRDTLFWIMARTDELEEGLVQAARSDHMINRYRLLKGQTELKDTEKSSLADEESAAGKHREGVQAELKRALAAGRGVFRGVRRNGGDFGATHDQVLAGFYKFALPDLYPKLEMGVRPKLKGATADRILKAANLNGLPAVFYGSPDGFDLVTPREGGKYAVDVDAPLLKEVRSYLERESSFGNKVTGKGLEERFGRPPYGWEAGTLMLALAALLRGGALVVTYQGRRYRDHLDPQGHGVFDSAAAFRAAAFAPRGAADLKTLVAAAQRYERLTGQPVDIEETAIAAAFKKLAGEELGRLPGAAAVARANGLPGADTLGDYGRALEALRDDGSDELVRRMAQAEEGDALADLRARAARIVDGSNDKGLARYRRLRRLVDDIWPELDGVGGPPLPPDAAAWVDEMDETARSEAFYTPHPELDRRVAELEASYRAHYLDAHATRTSWYTEALDTLRAEPEWDALNGRARERVTMLLRHFVHEAELPEDALVCQVCREDRPALLADMAHLPQLLSSAVAELRRAAAPAEARIERLSLAEVVGVSPIVSTPAEVDALLARLGERLHQLVAEGARVILN